MYNESDSKYCYPNSDVLVNIPGFTVQEQLDAFERMITLDRLRLLNMRSLKGKYDRRHLCNIHKFIFKDIYPFAGELREEDIAKDNFRFANVRFLVSQTDQLLSELSSENLLKDLPFERFIERITYYFTELNVLHPFREGNGRTQREFIRSLALESGFCIEFAEVEPALMLRAMIESPYNNQRLMNILYSITMNK
ncbi:Fic family protein [Paenibacillus sp. J5C_2022]|uniref:Fic/DOC family protein n=1 Tax=Paenibacillus sp. J5C2022 TaxID=2977129 RepID=UPI0021CE8B09|nr:Fic family protein [Paenibacillus sp. J5C2022]MCU6712412.1 Fic family protein [Paenibacillus sp. J5C2022]